MRDPEAQPSQSPTGTPSHGPAPAGDLARAEDIPDASEAGGETGGRADPGATSDPSSTSDPTVTRRSFVLRALAAIAGLITAVLAVPIVGFAAAPFWRSKAPAKLLSDSVAPTLRSTGWSSAGLIDDFKLGVPQLVPLQRQVVDGWVAEQAPVVVYVVRSGDAEAIAYDIHCTHLGCPLSFSSGAERFLCHCHGGAFNLAGEVVGGPPPRPMVRYQTKVENGEIFVGDVIEEA